MNKADVNTLDNNNNKNKTSYDLTHQPACNEREAAAKTQPEYLIQSVNRQNCSLDSLIKARRSDGLAQCAHTRGMMHI